MPSNVEKKIVQSSSYNTKSIIAREGINIYLSFNSDLLLKQNFWVI